MIDIDIIEGRLCEKGYMKERYDHEKDDLVRTLTRKGWEEGKKLLKDPNWRKIAIKMMIADGWNEEEIRKFFETLK